MPASPESTSAPGPSVIRSRKVPIAASSSSRPMTAVAVMPLRDCDARKPVRTRCGRRSVSRGSSTTPAVGVDANPVAGLDPLRRRARTDHGREPVLAGDDGRVAHDAAGIEHCGCDRAEDRRPAGRRGRCDEDLALLELAELLRAEDDARTPSATPGRARRPGQPAAVGAVRGRQPLLDALVGDPPEHDRDRIGDRLGNPTESRRRCPLAHRLVDRPAPLDDRRPVARAREGLPRRPSSSSGGALRAPRVPRRVAGRRRPPARPGIRARASSAPNSRTLFQKSVK